MEFEECGICFHNHAYIQVLPCKHMYCKNCLNSICQKFNNVCAFCKQHIYKSSDYKQDDINRIIKVGNGNHAGLTLTDAPDGVKVLKMHKNDEACLILKKGDVIMSINGLKAFNHRQAVDIIDNATFNNVFLDIVIKQQNASNCNTYCKRLRW